MDDAFIVVIELGGEELLFDARLDTIGFVHKIYIKVSGVDIAFEPDEERHYRAIVKPSQIAALTDRDKQIIVTIAGALRQLSS